MLFAVVHTLVSLLDHFLGLVVCLFVFFETDGECYEDLLAEEGCRIGFNGLSEPFDFSLSDVIPSKVVEDDMYGNYLDEFPTESQCVCSDEKPGKEFVVLFGE